MANGRGRTNQSAVHNTFGFRKYRELESIMLRRRKTTLRVQELERRDAPATLIGLNKVTYQDIDGDNVTVTLSKTVLTSVAVANAVFKFDAGTINDPGDNSTKQQLQMIDLTALADPSSASGTMITVTAVRSPATGGDGFAAVGEIVATNIDLGTVKIDGDLGRIAAGDTTTTTQGLKSLTTHSVGLFGTSTGAPSLYTEIQGSVGFLKVQADVREAYINVLGGSDGKLGSVFIGGSLIGGAATSSGAILAEVSIGPVTIRGNLMGAGGTNSGYLWAKQKIESVNIGGSVQGGTGVASARITCYPGTIGTVRIKGNLTGGAGIASGDVSTPSFVAGTIARVTVGGSVTGGAGVFSGRIWSASRMGTVTIGGNLTGGGEFHSGSVDAQGGVSRVRVGGNVQGGTGDFSGVILSDKEAGTITIGGDLIGGSATGTDDLTGSGWVAAEHIDHLTIGGSVIAGTDDTSGTFWNNGVIRVSRQLGTVLIKGSLLGNVTNPVIISAGTYAATTKTPDLVIGSLRVLGHAEFTQILAGVGARPDDLTTYADAQIGTVKIGGDWVASSIAAGILPGPDGFYGNADDVPMTGGSATVFSKITSLTIGGLALGTGGGIDSYGIVAENVGALKIGGKAIPLSSGIGNDDFFVGITGDFKVHEI